MMVTSSSGSRCEACGIPKPQHAVGGTPIIDPLTFREMEGVKPFRYVGSLLCVSCRFAPTLPGKLSYKNVRRLG